MSESPEIKKIDILSYCKQDAVKELDKLVKKAKKYGNPDINYSISDPFIGYADHPTKPRKIKVKFVTITVRGESPKIGNYEFLAKIEPVKEGINTVMAAPGKEGVEEKYRDVNVNYCDHCKIKRYRKAVYVVRDMNNGNQLQIGSNCLKDFFGYLNPEEIVRKFSFIKSVEDVGDDYGVFGKHDPYFATLESVLTVTSALIRKYGWVSRSQAEMNENAISTASSVQSYYFDDSNNSDVKKWKKEILESISDEDRDVAAKTIEWVRSIKNPDNDYMYNLTALFSIDMVHERKVSFVISAVSAYFRAMNKIEKLNELKEKNKDSEFQGTVGERIRDIKAKLDFVYGLGDKGFGETYLYKFRAENGNLFSWITTKELDLTVGTEVVFDGTIKKHNEYKGVKENNVTRVKVKNQ